MKNDQTDSKDNLNAFDLLHPTIQQKLYEMRWTELRPIQVNSIRQLLQGEGHLIISARTAGGKTEAAFLPILSNIVESSVGSVRALYVGPLKALINDQFRRLEELCGRASIPVHKWHGDVGAGHKAELLREPSGVLLITPESLESLFINRPHHLDNIFANLSYIVIDEMHSFMGTERGAHLKSLIYRIVAKSREKVRLIGLSATLGDMNLACDWLRLDSSEEIKLITDDSEEKTIKYMLHGYLRPRKEIKQKESNNNDDALGELFPTSADEKLAADLDRCFKGKTALIFANSKVKIEFYADLVRKRNESMRLPNPFMVHHGSLSKAEREDAEDELRSERRTAVFCSSTLEMGIDIGNVSIIGQIGAPWSVNSLVQRLGRSGRGDDETSVMRMFIEEYESDENIVKQLFPSLLQAVAMSELMLEKWCEPPQTDRLHLSTLVHQILSIIAETGGIKADKLASRLIERGAFSNISNELFVQTLRSIGSKDLIEQTPDGDLILGLEGERLVRRFDFYAAFKTDEELRVLWDARCIGTVANAPDTGADGFLILAGRRWKVIEVDTKRKEILVVPSKGARLPYFAPTSGSDIHPKVREKMREVLLSENIPVYLDDKAVEMLKMARTIASKAGINKASFYKDGSNIFWFTWTGSKVNRTLLGLGKHFGKLRVQDEGIALNFDDTPAEEIVCIYKGFLKECPSSLDLAAEFPALEFEKFDGFLSEEILEHSFSINNLDMMGAMNIIAQL